MSSNPLDLAVTEAELAAMTEAAEAFGGLAKKRASEFLGATGVGPEAELLILQYVGDGMRGLDFEERREVGEHFKALIQLLGSGTQKVTVLEAVSAEEGGALGDEPVTPTSEELPEVNTADEEVFDEDGEPALDLKKLSLSELADILPKEDSALTNMSHGAKHMQDNILEKIFGHERKSIATRLPLAARQWLIQRLMAEYDEMRIPRVTKHGKAERQKQMAMLFEGKNCTEIQEYYPDVQPSAISHALKTVTNSFNKPRLLDQVGLDLDATLHEALEYAISGSIEPIEQAEAEAEELHIPESYKSILEAMHMMDPDDARVFLEIFDANSTEPPEGEEFDDMRAMLRKITRDACQDTGLHHVRLEDVESNLLWGIIGRPEPHSTPPRAMVTVAAAYRAQLSSRRIKPEEALHKALTKISQHRKSVLETSGVV